MKTLDLGCGANPRNPFGADEIYGVDVRDLGPNIRRANLFLEPIPFDDDQFDFVTAHDFVEHVPRVLSIFNLKEQKNEIVFPFIQLMNEIYRVLKVGGTFFSRTPAYPHAAAFQDPTHNNIITEETFKLYFNDYYPVAHIYGFRGGFRMQDQHWDGVHLVSVLVKSPAPDLSRFQQY